jgi:hypothetical protein
MRDLRAELCIFIDTVKMLFDFNVVYLRDGGEANVGWESAGIFASTHDALEQGRRWFADAKANGFNRGATCRPRVWKSAA